MSCLRRSSTSHFISPLAKLRARSTARRPRWATLRTFCAVHRLPRGSLIPSTTLAYSSALLNAGHKVSRSHASAGSLKTTASRQEIHDVFRAWARRHPVRMDRISETSPAAKLLSKEIEYVCVHLVCVCVWSMTDGGSYRMEVDFGKHPESVTRTSDVRIVRYQQNPAPNWGPGSRAGGKRKRARSESDEGR